MEREGSKEGMLEISSIMVLKKEDSPLNWFRGSRRLVRTKSSSSGLSWWFSSISI